MRIAYFSGESWEKDYIKTALSGTKLDIDLYEGSIQENPEAGGDDIEALSVFVKSTVGKEELDRFPNLKFITTRSTGFDHIDLEETQARGITVSNVPTYGENTVAEFAFALILALARKTYEAYDRIARTGSFSQEGLRGFDLNGKTIGVIGCGNIGRHAIRMAKGFGMHVVAFDVHKDEAFAQEMDFSYVELDELLGQSDIITLHVPYNEHTHHMINTENIKNIKEGAYLINTSRGAVVETGAIIQGLEDGILAGAGLDVLEEEGDMGEEMDIVYGGHPEQEHMQTLLANHYLIDHPRVIITPHNAFNTHEALERILDTTAENIKGFAEGEPVHVVSPKE